MTGPLVMIGGGEHARVVAEAAFAAGWTPSGYTSRSEDALGVGIEGLRRLGSDDELVRRLEQAGDDAPSLVLAFGGAAGERRRVVDAFGARARWASVVHPAALVSTSAVIETGAVILGRAIVNSGARIGAHAIVNSGAIIEHDVVVGAFTHVAPGAVIGGGTRIGADVFVGLGAAVRDHVTIGDGAQVAMGAVVVTDVPPGSIVIGVPARRTARGNRREEPT
jgi:acetyltransferase EpsM